MTYTQVPTDGRDHLIVPELMLTDAGPSSGLATRIADARFAAGARAGLRSDR